MFLETDKSPRRAPCGGLCCGLAAVLDTPQCPCVRATGADSVCNACGCHAEVVTSFNCKYHLLHLINRKEKKRSEWLG